MTSNSGQGLFIFILTGRRIFVTKERAFLNNNLEKQKAKAQ